MKTITVTPEAMRQRHVAFAGLQPYQKQLEASAHCIMLRISRSMSTTGEMK